jgi:hypothetical protein
MSTYYNYVRRGTESQVDWGKIGSGISQEITRISQERDAKRQELDKLSMDLVKGASQVALPELDYLRNTILNGTNEMKNLALTQNRLLKEGKITPSQYRMVMENMKNNVQSLDRAVKAFGPTYTKAVDLVSKGQMSWADQQKFQKLFQYGNLENKSLIINADGNFVFTDLDNNGDPIADPSRMMSVGVLEQGLGTLRPKFDVKKTLDDAFKSIGEVTEILRSGGVQSEKSVLNNPEYKSLRDSLIESIVEDPDKILEVMGDYYGYKTVEDKSKATGKNLYMDSNGNVLPTDQQKNEVREKLLKDFDSRISIDRTAQPIKTGGKGKDENKFKPLYEVIITDLNGDKVTAEDAVLATGANVRNINELNAVLRRMGSGISATAKGTEFTDGRIVLSAPGASTIEVEQGDLDGLREAVEQIRSETFGSPVTPIGSGGIPGASSR